MEATRRSATIINVYSTSKISPTCRLRHPLHRLGVDVSGYRVCSAVHSAVSGHWDSIPHSRGIALRLSAPPRYATSFHPEDGQRRHHRVLHPGRWDRLCGVGRAVHRFRIRSAPHHNLAALVCPSGLVDAQRRRAQPASHPGIDSRLCRYRCAYWPRTAHRNSGLRFAGHHPCAHRHHLLVGGLSKEQTDCHARERLHVLSHPDGVWRPDGNHHRSGSRRGEHVQLRCDDPEFDVGVGIPCSLWVIRSVFRLRLAARERAAQTDFFLRICQSCGGRLPGMVAG